MSRDNSVSETLKMTEERIDWVLSSANISEWLKDALRSAMDRDPVGILNELEMLNTLLRPRCQCLIELAVSCADGSFDERD